MTDVLIRHCTLRIVRRAGWSWGEEPRRLLRGVVEALPALLAARLAAILPPGIDGELRQPLTVAVPLRLGELKRLAGGDLAESALGERLAAALEGVLPAALAAVEAVRADRLERGPGSGEDSLESGPVARDLVAARLLAWRRAGTLAGLLSLLPEEDLAPLADRLLALAPAWAAADGRASAPAEEDQADEEPLALDLWLSGRLAALPPEVARLPRVARLLWLAAEAAAERRVAPGDPRLAAALFRRLPPAAVGEPGPPTTSAPSGARAPAALPGTRPRSVESRLPSRVTPPGLRPCRSGEVQVPSALPWLLLGPLARMGYLDTLGAAFDLAGVGHLAPCFASLLAFKVLPPPPRGWRRSAASAGAAAAFAGLAALPDDGLLAQFGRRLEPALGLPDADLARATLAGAEAGEPLLLLPLEPEEGGGLLAFDPAGLFPLAWKSEARELAPLVGAEVAGSASPRPLLVPEERATPSLLAALAAEGLAFLTPAPPGRGESWSRQAGLRSEGRPLWSNLRGNRPTDLTAALRRAAARLAESASRAGELARELAARPAAVSIAPGSPLDRTLALAAGSALGTLAWTLWREREPTDPLLALHRFADLEARVRFEGDRIQVRLPLGKRHRDLSDHGLLEPVGAVPWLDGRVVELYGG